MDFKKLSDSFKLAEETEDAIWGYPILEDGSVSTEKVKLADKGKQTDPFVFVRVAWANANAYLKAAALLKKESVNDSHLLLSASVQAAFACEVYLKCLLDPDNISGDKHDLKNLYDKLTKDLDIDTKIQEKLPQGITIEDFKETLVHNAGIFKKLRYVYEFNSFNFNLDFLIWFADTLMGISKDKLNV